MTKVHGISGGPIERFREAYDSLCGLSIGPTHPGISPLTPGVFMVERCKRCIRQRELVPAGKSGKMGPG